MKRTEAATLRETAGKLSAAVAMLTLTALLTAGAISVISMAVPAGATSPGKDVEIAAAWTTKLAAADGAIARRDIGGAADLVDEAYRAAIAGRSWEGLLAAGDEYAVLARVTGEPTTWLPRARQAYLKALFRASAAESGPGALRVAAAFAALGDRDPVRESLRVADGIAVRNGDQVLRRQVAELAQRSSVSLQPGRLALLFERLTSGSTN